MRTLRLPVGALLVALLLGAVLAVGASATPVAKTVATVACEGASATLLMHPGGGGKAIWDISTRMFKTLPATSSSASKRTFYVGGEVVGTLDNSWGEDRLRRAAHPCSRCTRTAWTCTGHCTLCSSLTRHPLRMRLRGASVRRGGARGRGTATRPETHGIDLSADVALDVVRRVTARAEQRTEERRNATSSGEE